MGSMRKADVYRKRSELLDKKIKKSDKLMKGRLIKKKEALDAMAKNEDWLSGQPGSAVGCSI
jgi:hypothetical protein